MPGSFADQRDFSLILNSESFPTSATSDDLTSTSILENSCVYCPTRHPSLFKPNKMMYTMTIIIQRSTNEYKRRRLHRQIHHFKIGLQLYTIIDFW